MKLSGTEIIKLIINNSAWKLGFLNTSHIIMLKNCSQYDEKIFLDALIS